MHMFMFYIYVFFVQIWRDIALHKQDDILQLIIALLSKSIC